MESSDTLTRSQKFDKISPIFLTLVGNFKKRLDIFSNFVAFLLYLDFMVNLALVWLASLIATAPFVSKSKKEKFVGSTSVAYSPKVV